MAALFVGGLLALNPAGLRDLILADSSPGTALGLLLFGFVVTFGSTAMGTAIMAMGKQRRTDDEAARAAACWWRSRSGRRRFRQAGNHNAATAPNHLIHLEKF